MHSSYHAGTHAFRIPEVYYVGDAPGGSFILMEYLNFEGARKSSQALLGECLGRMHAATPQHPKAQEGYFGFDVDNTIGGTPQPNPWTKDWVTFLRDHRLRHQLSLAQDSTLSKLGDTLCNSLHLFFPSDLLITPSILHGDLWSGNIATVDGMPSLYDPACYYGHSEAEFGMSWCAGFSREFWDSYHSIIPRQPGFQERHQIYTLYHYLNHYNLFGGGYYSQCTQTLQALISRIPK
jgi:protein-ribulosamine 3-kinase